jgi:hypothetical protein
VLGFLLADSFCLYVERKGQDCLDRLWDEVLEKGLGRRRQHASACIRLHMHAGEREITFPIMVPDTRCAAAPSRVTFCLYGVEVLLRSSALGASVPRTVGRGGRR